MHSISIETCTGWVGEGPIMLLLYVFAIAPIPILCVSDCIIIYMESIIMFSSQVRLTRGSMTFWQKGQGSSVLYGPHMTVKKKTKLRAYLMG